VIELPEADPVCPLPGGWIEVGDIGTPKAVPGCDPAGNPRGKPPGNIEGNRT